MVKVFMQLQMLQECIKTHQEIWSVYSIMVSCAGQCRGIGQRSTLVRETPVPLSVTICQIRTFVSFVLNTYVFVKHVCLSNTYVFVNTYVCANHMCLWAKSLLLSQKVYVFVRRHMYVLERIDVRINFVTNCLPYG